MKMKKLVALASSLCMLASTTAFAEETANVSADTNSSALIAYNDFEDYEIGYEMGNADGYKYGGSNATTTVDKADVVLFDGSKRIEMSSSNASRTETKITIDNLATTKTIVTGFSIYVDEQIDAAYANIRTNGGVVSDTFKLSAESNLVLGTTSTGVRFEKDTWYDIVEEIDMETGDIKAYVKGGSTDGLFTGKANVSSSTETRYTFIIDKAAATDTGMTKIYMDDFFAYSISKTTTPAYTGKCLDFENFVHSGNAASPASGMTMSNSQHTEVSKVYDEEAGNCLKFDIITASKYPELRIAVDDSGISGESVLEFDYKASAGSRAYFSVRGSDSAGKTVSSSLRLVQLLAGGKVKVNSRNADDTANESIEMSETLVADTWYHYVVKMNTDDKTLSVSISAPGKNTITYSGKMNESTVYSIKTFEIFSYGAPVHSDYLDNVIFRSGDTPVAFCDSTLEKSAIVKNDNKVTFSLNTAFATSITDYCFKINTTEVTPVIFGNVATLTIPENIGAGDFCFVEASCVDADGNSVYAVKLLNVVDEIVISDFAYDTEASDGTVGATAKVLSNCDDCTTAVLITAIYDATSNELITLTSDDADLTVGTAATLSTNIKLPENNSDVKVVSFIWKGLTTSIAPLCQPLPLQ